MLAGRAEGKTRCETACLTCQYDQGYTQVTRMDGLISKTTPSQVGVLFQREWGILRGRLDGRPSNSYSLS